MLIHSLTFETILVNAIGLIVLLLLFASIVAVNLTASEQKDHDPSEIIDPVFR